METLMLSLTQGRMLAVLSGVARPLQLYLLGGEGGSGLSNEYAGYYYVSVYDVTTLKDETLVTLTIKYRSVTEEKNVELQIEIKKNSFKTKKFIKNYKKALKAFEI